MSKRKAVSNVLKVQIEEGEPATKIPAIQQKCEQNASHSPPLTIEILSATPNETKNQKDGDASASCSQPTPTAAPLALPFKCSICKQTFASKLELTAHVKDHFKVYECPICHLQIIGDTQYEYHQKNLHDAADEDIVPPKVDQPRTCKHCTVCLAPAEMLQHVSAAHPDKVKCYKCDYCDERWPSHSQMNIHVHVEHEEQCMEAMACDICGRVCRNREAVLLHRRTHEDDKSFTCKTCGKGFTRRSNLEFHMRTHTGERPFKCAECPKTFAHVSGLNCHRRVHTGERPYQCPFCDKSYIHSTDLRRHRRSHGREEKRFECEVCDRKFFERKFLVTHMRSHRDISSKVINIEMQVLSKEEVDDDDVVDEEAEEAMIEEYIF